MNKMLGEIAVYSKERISLEKLNTETYVTTDNLLQNKEGKTSAVNLPPQGGAVTKFLVGDILIANIRPYLKKIWLASHDGGSSSDVLTLKVKDFNSSFIYYSLFRDIFFDHMMNGSKGTKMPRGDKNHVLEFPIPDFKREKQDKIAKVLSDLDSKIELNNKINKELEAMAKLIYDYWFVQFDFPDENGKPYKSSGGKMVYNEELKREIPEGWQVGSLVDIATYTNGIACQKYPPIDDNHLRVIKIKEMREGFSGNSDLVTVDIPEKVKVYDGDVLFSWSASLEVIIWTGGTGALNQHIFKVTSNSHPKSFYYFELMNYLKHFKMLAELRKTTMGHITQDHLKQSRIVIPPEDKVQDLDKTINPILEKIVSNNQQNHKLVELRDWLLPMLMNGQLTVKEAEEKLSKAAEPKVAYKPSKKLTHVDYYKRIVLAAEIVWQLHKQPTLGHLKLQKIMYLTQQIGSMMLPTNFLRQAAGPYDPQMARSLDKQLKKKKWFEYKKDEFLKYKPLEHAGGHKKDFEKYFQEEKEGIQYLIDTFRTAKSSSIEIVATLYACWKELLKNCESFSEELLIEQFYEWSEEKSKYKRERLLKAINWMNEKGIVPTSKS